MIRDEIYKFFADYIFQNSGMVYSASDYYRLESRINDLVKILGGKDAEDIYQMYKKNITPDMKALLINISTNNETYFFRDIKPFSVFGKTIVPELLSKTSVGSINVWSAASSTGQEALSILMSVQNQLGDTVLSRINLVASDISSGALDKARKGIYTGLDVQRGLPITLLMKYFTQTEGENWQVNKNLLGRIKFFEFNLLKDLFPIVKYHVIFCRNVLIYQDIKNKNVILNNIYESLVPGGYLFLGNGESLIGVETKFKRLTIDGYTVFHKE